MQTEFIEEQIRTQIHCEHLSVTGDGHHFEAQVVSDDFVGKSRVQRQQMVYACVQAWIASGELHALSIKSATITEWQQTVKE